MTRLSVSIGSSVTFGFGTRCRRFLRRHVVGVCTRYERACLPCLPLYPLSWRIEPTQGRQRTMWSTSALDGIDRNQLSAESWCFLGELAVVSIHPIEVAASTPSQGSTSSVADPSVVGLVYPLSSAVVRYANSALYGSTDFFSIAL